MCGILMEMEDDYLLIGMGCNVMVAPIIENGAMTVVDNRHVL